MKQYTPNEGIRVEEHQRNHLNEMHKMKWNPLCLLTVVLFVVLVALIVVAVLK